MKEIRTGMVSAFITIVALFVLAPSLPVFNSAGSYDIVSYIVRWQTPDYDPATRPESKNHLLTTATDTLGSIRGTARDTTAIFEIAPFMTALVKLTDATTDSANQTFLFYTGNDNQFRKNVPEWSEFIFVDSLVVSNENLARWDLDNNLPKHKYGFIIARGNETNKKAAAVTAKILLSTMR